MNTKFYMTSGKLYPLGDSLNIDERKELDVSIRGGLCLTSLGIPPRGVKAKRTGEFRCPKKGEWYLSGAIVEAYRAPNDLSSQFHIATLVKV